MVKLPTMAHQPHSWHATARTAGRRFAFGLLTSLSLTLVAFEWKSTGPRPIEPTWGSDEIEPPIELPTVFIIEKAKANTAPKPKQRRPAVTVDPSRPEPVVTEPTVDPGPTTPEPSGSEPAALMPPETPDPIVPLHISAVGVRPYFVDCLKRSSRDRDECTETRIQQHLQRKFRIPEGVRGTVRTTITFEIDTEGGIGRIICTPRVSQAVEAEIERVLRGLPEFVPGKQGVHPVSVYYQIPLSVKTL